MCTIMGFSKKTLTRQEITPFLERTVSRGPDMSRIIETPSGWLCFQRLAIMGLTEAGMQPFSLGGDMVVCNGEIYGFRPLKRQLEERQRLRGPAPSVPRVRSGDVLPAGRGVRPGALRRHR